MNLFQEVEGKLFNDLDVDKCAMLRREFEHTLNVCRKRVSDLRTPASVRLGRSASLDVRACPLVVAAKTKCDSERRLHAVQKKSNV